MSSDEELDEINKRHIYNILFHNSIKFVSNKLKNDINNLNDISKILYMIANIRYKIEFLLSKLFPKLDLDINLDKFGRIRTRTGNHGRQHSIECGIVKKYYYTPFQFMIDSDYYEVLFTPIYIKYKHYNDKIKKLCLDNDKFIKNPNSYCFHNDTNIYDKKNTYNLNKNEPIFHLLHKYENIGFNIKYKHVDLTSFYYELNDELYNELENIPMNNRFLSNDINMYRAIYHTNPKSHQDILKIINKKYLQIIYNINNVVNFTYEENLILIKKIYWFLSHATLYERGSCAITEILCNSLLLFINPKEEFYTKNNVNKFKEYKIFKNKKNINTDIEAMLEPNPDIFNKTFDNFVNYTSINDLDDFNDINDIKCFEFQDNIFDNFNVYNLNSSILFKLLNKKIKINEQNSNISNLINEFNI
jgi:hypothetical protein